MSGTKTVTRSSSADSLEGPLGRSRLAIEWLEDGDALLDVGCSNGKLVSWARSKCASAVGIDVDHRMLRQARADLPEGEFLLGSAGDLPFEDQTFSVVTMLDVLEHVPDPISSLREVERVLRPNGRLILSVPHKGTFASLDAQESLFFAAGRRILLDKKDDVMEHRHFTLEEVVRMVGPGFRMGRRHMGGYLLFPLCGYALMIADQVNVPSITMAFRRMEEQDFQRDYGAKSWHLMTEFTKVR